ncbi:hypothetical protein [Streptomyces sp. ISL-11]|uniref:hypothetical protein n=1 Tax=Streptomyces sp. ISL-11 TaxID=2819174 RepID=UPI001BEC530D|nr:hypothetical protein [Streptomyces sp. ISL-11]MBT2385017.1 hypothetical protein [Streptomyces sp. ISL-11]
MAPGLALAVVFLQGWLKFVSREPPNGKKHGLKMEDSIWWIDWIVTASIALVVLVTAASYDGKPTATLQVGLGFGVLFLGYSVIPFFVRQVCYDGRGKIKSWKHIAVLNFAGMAILLSSAAVGANVNGV